MLNFDAIGIMDNIYATHGLEMTVTYTKLYVMEKQSLLIRLRKSPQLFIVKCYKCLCRQFEIMEIRIVFFFFPCDSDRIVLLLKQYYYLLLRADIEIKMM